MTVTAKTAAQIYTSLEPDREPFLKRARECAALTIPFLMPPQGTNGATQLPTPYQSFGSRGLRTLASKLLLSMFPNFPFFKYQVDDLTMREIENAAQQQALRGEVEKALGARERAAMVELENVRFRPVAFMAIKQLLVAGNVLIYLPVGEGRAKAYRLDQFVLRRATDGELIEFILREPVNVDTLPLAVQQNVKLGSEASMTTTAGRSKPFLYTHVRRTPTGWEVYQEVSGVLIPGTKGTYKLDELPWIAPRLSTQPGEEYGRSYVEEFLGDLDSLEALSQAIVEASGAAARVIFFVNPAGTTSLRVVAKARSGDTVSGSAEDVSTLQLQKSQDLSVAKAQAGDIAQSLSFAFLMNAAIQRSGERVTAEEIRYMANELDSALGGIYTLLSLEFQLPTVTLLELRMTSNRNVKKLPAGITRPVIVTGLEAIGRGADQRNLKLFLQDVIQVIGPQMVAQIIDMNEFIKRSATSYGIDTEGLIKSPETQQQEAQAAQQQAASQNLAPELVKQAGGAIRDSMKADAKTA